MLFGLSPGCIAWMNLETPYLVYQREIDFLIFEVGDRTHSTCERRSGTPGVDVMVGLHDDNLLLGFVVWGGALALASRINGAFPKTLSGCIEALRGLIQDKFSHDLTFGRYQEEMLKLIEKHKDLPVQVIGGHPIDMN